MGDFFISRKPVPDWRGDTLPQRPMADQIGDLMEQFDAEKDMRSIGALAQGLRWIDETHKKDDTIDPEEWEAARRAMRKALGGGAPPGDRAQRIERAFAEESEPKKT